MANSQLKFHLLHEVIDEIGKKHSDVALLGNLLVASKESASALRWIVASHVGINSIYDEKDACRLSIKWGRWLRDIKSVYLQNFAIRNAQRLIIGDYYGENMELAKRASACLRLFVLDCPASYFAAMLNTNMDLSNLYKLTLQVKDFESYSSYASILSVLTFHPERCPNLDTIEIASIFSVETLMECYSDYCVPSVTHLAFDLKANCCTAIDYSMLSSSIPKCFPNMKEVKLEVNSNCKHPSKEIDLEIYHRLCEFKAYDFPFDFKFQYGQYNEYDEYHKDLENLFTSKGELVWKYTETGRNYYEIMIAHPKKTMTVQVSERLRI